MIEVTTFLDPRRVFLVDGRLVHEDGTPAPVRIPLPSRHDKPVEPSFLQHLWQFLKDSW